MFRNITGVKIESLREYGLWSRRASVGDSVARAIAAKVSIKTLIQSNCRVLRG
jgi:hypothetical protein